MRFPISDIVTGILSRTVSELSQFIVQILATLHFRATLWGVGTTYDVHRGLTGKRVVDFLLVLIKLFAGYYGCIATNEEIENRQFRSNVVTFYSNFR